MAEMTPEEKSFVCANAPKVGSAEIAFFGGRIRSVSEGEGPYLDSCFMSKDVYEHRGERFSADVCDIHLCFPDDGRVSRQDWVEFAGALEISDPESGLGFECFMPPHTVYLSSDDGGGFAIPVEIFLRVIDENEEERPPETPVPAWEQFEGHRINVRLSDVRISNRFSTRWVNLSGTVDADGTGGWKSHAVLKECFCLKNDMLDECENRAEATALTPEERSRVRENRPITQLEKIEFSGGFGKPGDPDFPQTQVFSTDEITKAVKGGTLTEYCHATFFFRDKGMPSERKRVRFINSIQIICCGYFNCEFNAPESVFEATADKDGRFSVRVPFWLRTVDKSEKASFSILDRMKKEETDIFINRVSVSNSEIEERRWFSGTVPPDGTFTDLSREVFWYSPVRNSAENKPGQPD